MALSERQSLFLGVDAQGRYEDGGLRGGLLQADARYYFRQSPRRLFFMDLSAEAGRNLDADQQILLGGDNGLRGYPLRYQAGEGRWLFTAEQRFFTNWYPFQLFNVGAAVFYDMGATWGRDPLGSPSQGLLRDFGFGLRLGNSRSALGNVLHVDVAFPLDGDSSINSVQFLVETKEEFLMIIRGRLRPMIRVEALVLMVVAWVVATANFTWWSAVAHGRHWSQPSNWWFVVCCFTALVALHFVLLARWLSPGSQAAAHVIVVASAAAACYMRTYAVVLDPDDDSERAAHRRARSGRAADLEHGRMGARMVGACRSPSSGGCACSRVKPLGAALLRAATVLGALVMAVLAVLPISRDLTSFMRNQREARYLITPGNYLYGLAVNSRASRGDATRTARGGRHATHI